MSIKKVREIVNFIRTKKNKKKNVCVFQVSRPYIGFCPDPKPFIVKCEQHIVKYAGKCREKCNFCIKYFDKIKCYADRSYLAFSELKPETHNIYFCFPNYSTDAWLIDSLCKI